MNSEVEQAEKRGEINATLKQILDELKDFRRLISDLENKKAGKDDVNRIEQEVATIRGDIREMKESTLRVDAVDDLKESIRVMFRPTQDQVKANTDTLNHIKTTTATKDELAREVKPVHKATRLGFNLLIVITAMAITGVVGLLVLLSVVLAKNGLPLTIF